ncbi:MAG: F0F1 ATP synthase subunit B [Thermoflexales bacterium]|nr:F0F1 ATP synthase subunit B [Thermoflexales bacterium]MCX7938867.1 F0F1 ATP synthase subunit B [Thermoflexales bacterium]MDW8291621.1 F0F1 ATP synthase subunit B [Anaerolineae bacterium]
MQAFLALTRIAAEGGGSDPFTGLGINFVQVIAQIINFLLIMYFLNGMVIRPVLRNLEARRKRIEESLENARKADERLANVEKDYQARMAEAAAEAQKLRAEALAAAQQEAQRIRAEAQAEAERIRQQARIDAQAERNQLLADARNQIVALVIAATNKLVGDSLDANRQRALINDFFSKVPAVSFAGVQVAGAPVTVTSALPLTPEEQARVKADLEAHLGSISEIHFNVDPSILGGLTIRVGDKVIDGSVASKINALRAQLAA